MSFLHAAKGIIQKIPLNRPGGFNSGHAEKQPEIITLHGFGDIAQNAQYLPYHLGLSNLPAIKTQKVAYPWFASEHPWQQSFILTDKSDHHTVNFNDRDTPFQSYLGSWQDLTKTHEMVQHKTQNKPLILAGHSRGGAAGISYTAQQNPENLKALVTFGAPCSMPQVVADWFGNATGSETFGKYFLATIFNYQKNNPTPLEAIKDIKNKDLPVILVHADGDKIVKQDHGKQLYDEFKIWYVDTFSNHKFPSKVEFKKYLKKRYTTKRISINEIKGFKFKFKYEKKITEPHITQGY